jgi:ribosomal protein L11 methyltransferase
VAIAATIATRLGVPPRQVRAAIKALLQSQDLIYSYEMGSSFLLENTLRPWSPIEGIWILPPDIRPAKWEGAGFIVIPMGAGAAFGSEGHPSTKLCLQALYDLYRHGDRAIRGRALDIGSGSGILSLAAAKMGCTSVLAVDTDPCARHETRVNTALNHLEDSVHVDERPLDEIDGGFDLVLANLRFPTLKTLAVWVADHLNDGGVLVVSGLFGAELGRLEPLYASRGLEMVWERADKRWASGCFKLNAG